MTTKAYNYDITVRGYNPKTDWSTDQGKVIIEHSYNDGFTINRITLTEESAQQLLNALTQHMFLRALDKQASR